MNRWRRKVLFSLFMAVATLVCFQTVRAQDTCLTRDDINKMQAQLKSQAPVTFDKKLHDELLKLRKKDFERAKDAIAKKPDEIMDRLRQSQNQNVDSLCPILKARGWPTRQLVGPDGADAAFFLLRNTSDAAMRAALLPVIIIATSQSEIELPDFAAYLDRVRLSAGLKQLFGTQAT